jgi:hypothetical protein
MGYALDSFQKDAAIPDNIPGVQTPFIVVLILIYCQTPQDMA